MLLLVECIGLFDVGGRSVLFQLERWVCFLSYVFADRTSLVIGRMISTVEDTSNITRSFFFRWQWFVKW
jgi:hypothetical protein